MSSWARLCLVSWWPHPLLSLETPWRTAVLGPSQSHVCAIKFVCVCVSWALLQFIGENRHTWRAFWRCPLKVGSWRCRGGPFTTSCAELVPSPSLQQKLCLAMRKRLCVRLMAKCVVNVIVHINYMLRFSFSIIVMVTGRGGKLVVMRRKWLRMKESRWLWFKG